MNDNDLNKLLQVLVTQPKECEWLEFKADFHNEEEIGERLSALSNSACLLDKSFGYLVFGVKDETQEILGTSFSAKMAKKGNEELELWLLNRLNPKVDYDVFEFKTIDGKHICMFRIPAATSRPVSFLNVEYIRVGSLTKRLQSYPDKEAKIWKKSANRNLACLTAKEMLTSNDVIDLLSVETYFDLMKLPFPLTQESIIGRLNSEHFIIEDELGWSITKLGALLLAKDLRDFDMLSRKAIRVIVYRGKNKIETVREQMFYQGYAVCMETLVRWINSQLPQSEVIGTMLRQNIQVFPELAIREMVGNMVIHQDFGELGGPVIDIYTDRIEFTNPGLPQLDVNRFIDEYSSRNESLGDIMRRMGFCEEKGSGWDKAVSAVESQLLPPIKVILTENRTTVRIESYKKWGEMTKKDRLTACYQHACLKYVSNETMSNQSLRQRFAVDTKNYPMISRLLKEAQEAHLIKEANPEDKNPRTRSYIPYWG